MRFGKLTALAGVTILALALVIGCSDDDSSTSSDQTFGSLTDPEFIPVKAQIDTALTTIVNDIASSFGNLYVAPGDDSVIIAQLSPPSINPDPDADPDVIHTYLNGWHYIYAYYDGEVYFSAISDSIQYIIAGDPVENPGVSVDALHVINNWAFTALDQAVTHTDYEGRDEFVVTKLDEAISAVSGTSEYSIQYAFIGVDTTMTTTFTFDMTFTDLQVSKEFLGWVSGCPTSGEMVFSINEGSVWTNAANEGEDHTIWSVGVTFTDGSVVVNAGNGTENWRYEADVCTVVAQ